MRRERARDCRAPDKGDEFPPPHGLRPQAEEYSLTYRKREAWWSANVRSGSRVDGALASAFLRCCSIGRVRSRVRPVDAADVAAGPNALRGSGPQQSHAL